MHIACSAVAHAHAKKTPVDSTYKCKTRQNATLTGQERQRNVQRYVSFVLLYFDFWTILVQGRFDDSSHFVHVIDTHYVWAAFGNIKAESMSKCCFLFPHIPAGKAKRKESLIQTFYETSAAHFFD